MWVVEFHLTQRVMRQFGLFQEYPLMYEDTDRMLHRYVCGARGSGAADMAAPPDSSAAGNAAAPPAVAWHCCGTTLHGATSLELKNMLKIMEKFQQLGSKFCRNSAATTSSQASHIVQNDRDHT
jgi:hypothetical protein